MANHTPLPGAYAVRAPRIIEGVNRVGHSCIVLRDSRISHHLSRVRFEDGAEAVLSRLILRRLPERAIDPAAAN